MQVDDFVHADDDVHADDALVLNPLCTQRPERAQCVVTRDYEEDCNGAPAVGRG